MELKSIMRTVEAVKTLAEWDRCGWNVFTLSDMRKLFPQQAEKTLSESLRRLVGYGLLERVANGVFVNPLSTGSRVGLFERIACTIRRGEYNYLSLECALSQWGVISQIPQAYLTVVTTGRKGVFNTAYGVIEFTHTQRSAVEIMQNHNPNRASIANCNCVGGTAGPKTSRKEFASCRFGRITGYRKQ